MGPFAMALTSLAVEEVLAEQASVEWRAQHSFHVPIVQVPLQFWVEGTLITIQPGCTPSTINLGPLPSMAKPPNWL
jgi:hypothetical protein